MDGPSEGEPTNAINKQPPPLAVRTALRLTDSTSDKYIPAPSSKMILAGHIEMLSTFQPRVRDQARKVEMRELTNEELRTEGRMMLPKERNAKTTNAEGKEITIEWTDPEQEEELQPTGLGTGLYDKSQGRTSNRSDHESVERFLSEFEQQTSGQLNKKVLYQDTRKTSTFDKTLTNAIVELRKQSDWVLVPTDKTNRWKELPTEKYIKMVLDHINKSSVEINAEHLKKVEKEANELMLKHHDLMDEGERGFVKAWIHSKCIPTPRLLIKD